jgi:hypothetical protein
MLEKKMLGKNAGNACNKITVKNPIFLVKVWLHLFKGGKQ